MKAFILSIMFLSVFCKTKLYFFEKCDSSYTSFKNALNSIGVLPCLKYVLKIAKYNSVNYPDKMDYNYNFGDPVLDEYLLNLLKNGKLISYIDSYLSLSQIKENFNNESEFSETKNSLLIFYEYFIKKTDIKSPFIAGLLTVIHHYNNFGKINFFSGESKSIMDIPKEEWTKLSNIKTLGCLNWKDEKINNLINLYLEESKGNDKITMNQIILAETKMIVNQLEKSSFYDMWNTKIEFKDKDSCEPSPKSYVIFFTRVTDLSSYAFDNTYKKIFKIMTEINEKTENSKGSLIYKLQERVKELTKNLFGFQITFTDDYTAYIILPNGKLEIKLFTNIKIEKEGFIKYIIENNKIIKKEFSSANNNIDKLIDRIVESLKGKMKIFSFNEFNSKIEKLIKNGNIYMGYDFLTNSLEYTFIFTDKIADNIQYNEGVTYKFTFNKFGLDDQKVIMKEVVSTIESVAGQIISYYFKQYMEQLGSFFQVLKENIFNIFTLTNISFIIIRIIIWAASGCIVVPA